MILEAALERLRRDEPERTIISVGVQEVQYVLRKAASICFRSRNVSKQGLCNGIVVRECPYGGPMSVRIKVGPPTLYSGLLKASNTNPDLQSAIVLLDVSHLFEERFWGL
jgi:hypothetical protein